MTNIIKNSEKKNALQTAINLNAKMKNCYWWSPPRFASARRSYEKYNSFSAQFSLKGKKYEIKMETSCSCKNIYFSQSILVNGENKNITALKKALEILS